MPQENLPPTIVRFMATSRVSTIEIAEMLQSLAMRVEDAQGHGQTAEESKEGSRKRASRSFFLSVKQFSCVVQDAELPRVRSVPKRAHSFYARFFATRSESGKKTITRSDSTPLILVSAVFWPAAPRATQLWSLRVEDPSWSPLQMCTDPIALLKRHATCMSDCRTRTRRPRSQVPVDCCEGRSTDPWKLLKRWGGLHVHW